MTPLLFHMPSRSSHCIQWPLPFNAPVKSPPFPPGAFPFSSFSPPPLPSPSSLSHAQTHSYSADHRCWPRAAVSEQHIAGQGQDLGLWGRTVWAGSFPSGGPWELTVCTTEGTSLWSLLGPASLWPGLFSTKASWLGWKHGNPGEEVGAFCLLWAQGPCARFAAAWGQPVDAWRRQAIPQPHLSTAVPHWGASMWEANGGISGGTVP